jgi:hypothetical protein
MHPQERITQINCEIASAIRDGFTFGGVDHIQIEQVNKHLRRVDVPGVGTFTIRRDQIEYPEGLAPEVVAAIDLDHRSILVQFSPTS